MWLQLDVNSGEPEVSVLALRMLPHVPPHLLSHLLSIGERGGAWLTTQGRGGLGRARRRALGQRIRTPTPVQQGGLLLSRQLQAPRQGARRGSGMVDASRGGW